VWSVKDHLKFVEATENKEVEKSILITAQIYAQTNATYFNKIGVVKRERTILEPATFGYDLCASVFANTNTGLPNCYF